MERPKTRTESLLGNVSEPITPIDDLREKCLPTLKNEEGRVVYLTPELRVLLGEQFERVKDLERSRGRIAPWLFPQRGPRLAGERIRDFRKAWAEACKAAGVSGAFRHDFRRSAVRNLVNAGVPERLAMKITGHETRSVFDRSHIVSPGDLQEAVRRIHGHSSRHSRTDSVDRGGVSS